MWKMIVPLRSVCAAGSYLQLYYICLSVWLSGWLTGWLLDFLPVCLSVCLTDCLCSRRPSVLSPFCLFPLFLHSSSLNEAAVVLWGITRQGGVGWEGCRGGQRGGTWSPVRGRTEGSIGGQEGKAGGRCKPPPQALTATQEGDHRRSAHRCFNITTPPTPPIPSPTAPPHPTTPPPRPPPSPPCEACLLPLERKRSGGKRNTHTVLQFCTFLLVIRRWNKTQTLPWFSQVSGAFSFAVHNRRVQDSLSELCSGLQWTENIIPTGNNPKINKWHELMFEHFLWRLGESHRC